MYIMLTNLCVDENPEIALLASNQQGLNLRGGLSAINDRAKY